MKFMRNHWYDVAPGLVYLAVFIGGFMLKIGYGVLKKTDSPYFFPKEEFERGGCAERLPLHAGGTRSPTIAES